MRLYRKHLLPFISIASALALGVGCEKNNSDSASDDKDLTVAQYNSIQSNMKYSDVVGIIGRQADEVINTSDWAIIYKWNHLPVDAESIFCTFYRSNGLIVGKGCLGLGDAGGQRVSGDQLL